MQNKALATTNVRLRLANRPRLSTSKGLFRNHSAVSSATEGFVAPVKTTDESDDENTRQFYTGKKALVVGAGPAGSVAAAFLATQGFTVDVYERRGDITLADTKITRSSLISIRGKTLDVLRALNVELPDIELDFLNGIHRHLGLLTMDRAKMTTMQVGRSIDVFRCERNDLAANILSTVRRDNPDEITFHFEHPCVGVDLKNKEVHFQYQDDGVVKQYYDLLVGADGANSKVRKAMEEQLSSFTKSTTDNLLFHRSFRDITVNINTVPEKYKKMCKAGYTTRYEVDLDPRNKTGLHLVSFASLINGNFVGNFFASEAGLESLKGREEEYLKSVFPEDFPQDWIIQMALQLRENPAYRIPSIIEVSTLIGPDVVLLGDAGHAIGPRLGYGCNMAIQDGQELYNALEDARGDLDKALTKFNEVRHREVRSTQVLAQIVTASASEHKGISKLLPTLAIMHNAFHKYGNKYVPWLVPEEPLARFNGLKISAEEAVQTLQLELASLTVAVAVVLLGSFKAITTML